MKRPWVVKAGGELMIPGPIRKKILGDLTRLNKKHPIVFVHGGGPQIEQELLKNKVPTKFIGGRRVTSPQAMIYVERILSGQINKGITGDLNTKGVSAVGLSCRDGNIVNAKPLPKLGQAGRPASINISLLKTLLSSGFLPVVSSVGSDLKGAAININADDVASALAIELKAENLIFLSNIPGVLDHNKKRIPVLKTKTIQSLIAKNVITGGMIPKVQSARDAINKGVGEVDIMNGKGGINLKSGTRILK